MSSNKLGFLIKKQWCVKITKFIGEDWCPWGVVVEEKKRWKGLFLCTKQQKKVKRLNYGHKSVF
jgi:hypothetical protein